jgi:hypothetical protein
MTKFIISEEEKKQILGLYISEQNNGRSLNQNVVKSLIEGQSRDGQFSGFIKNDPFNFFYKFTSETEDGNLRFEIYKPSYYVGENAAGISIVSAGIVFVDTKKNIGFVENFSSVPIPDKTIIKQQVPTNISISKLVEYILSSSSRDPKLKSALTILKNNERILEVLNSSSASEVVKSFYNCLLTPGSEMCNQ